MKNIIDKRDVISTSQPFSKALIMYIIGEIGSNVKNHEEAGELILRLKEAGANAVKFQWISFRKLYGIDVDNPPEEIWGKIQADLEKKSRKIQSYTFSDLQKFAETAKAAGIDFMCSVFSPEDVKKLDPLVKHHKLASCEISHRPLIHALAKHSKKHVFVSTGAATDGDIDYVISTIGKDRVTLMYCDPSYPSTRSDLTTIQYLQNVYGVPVGLSDHSLEVYNTAFAAHWFFGAVALEKHVKLNGQCVSDDAGHSLTVVEFESMVKRIRAGHQFVPGKVPREVLRLHKRRLVATKKIHPYDRLRLGDNCDYFRMAFDPFRYQIQMADPQFHIYACHGEPETLVSTKTHQVFRPVSTEKLRTWGQ